MHDGQQYMFARAPFGLNPMTSIFQRGVSLILGDLPFVAVYVDDIVIFSDTAEEHRVHVQTVLDRLTHANLIINQENAAFSVPRPFSLGLLLINMVVALYLKRLPTFNRGHHLQMAKWCSIT
jgi:hypothetical protein